MASQKEHLNGIPVAITANLDCAIRHLRLTVLPRMMWIDALAMNQADVQERNDQVKIMGAIYSAAKRVVVWLGPVDQRDLHMRAVLGAMQFHFVDDECSTVTLFDYVCGVVSLMNEQASIIGDVNESVLNALHRIADRPWFHRIWVVQELALSTVATVCIGTYSFPWEPHKMELLNRRALLEAASRVYKSSTDRPFGTQLIRTLHLLATDPRDRVFTDYTKSAQRVFQEAMVISLQEGMLEAYLFMPLQPLLEQQNLDPFPSSISWVPDLRITGAAYKRVCSEEDYLDMSAENNYHRPIGILGPCQSGFLLEDHLRRFYDDILFWLVEFSEDLTQLFAAGRQIGTILETSGDLLYNLDNVNSRFGLPHTVRDWYHSVAKPNGVSAADFLWVLFRSVFYKDVSENALADLPFRKSQKLGAVFSRCPGNIAKQVLLTMDKGRVGVGYHPDPLNGIRPGDVVVGLFGVNFPFILRGNPDGSYQMINVVRVIGHTWGFRSFRLMSLYDKFEWDALSSFGHKKYIIV
ncbi:heterokaryon incompatibility protein-domain-containing protein [Phaeosphaeriaceae sp. PMI808]|nr:heterokaryon incompatibility protein-domain-containing protein [Phaeosphaeriaceae sp. PMI808]